MRCRYPSDPGRLRTLCSKLRMASEKVRDITGAPRQGPRRSGHPSGAGMSPVRRAAVTRALRAFMNPAIDAVPNSGLEYRS